MFEAQTTPGQSIFTRNSFAPRLGVSYDVTGKGNTVLKGFYGRYYYNYADSFGTLNPGGANYKTFKFLDQNGNKKYDGPSGARPALAARRAARRRRSIPNMKKPYADEYRPVDRTAVLGRVVGARRLRPEEHAQRVRDHQPRA